MARARGFVVVLLVVALAAAAGASGAPPALTVGAPANVTLISGNDVEATVAVNPTNPLNVVVVAQALSSQLRRGVSFDGGVTWTRSTILSGVACCSPQMTFDGFGNLFLVFINTAVNEVDIVLSTDGGQTFGAPVTVGTGSVDQPSVAAGAGSVWVSWSVGGSIVVRGAPVTGLGTWGPFGAQVAPPTATGSFGDIAVGPGGKVTVTYQSPTTGQGPATIYSNTDADGLGAGGFGARVTVTTTNVGGFDFIPAQPGRSIDAEANLAYDRSGGAHNGRLHLVYTEETVNENNDTEILVRYSDDSGTTWSAPVRVNDDAVGPIRSQFNPRLAVDQLTGNVGVTWYDARNDGGVPGSGSTNAIPNDDAMYYGSVSNDGGASFAPNVQISDNVSNAAAAGSSLDYGDYSWCDFAGGSLQAAWADNSNSTGDNPDGTLHAFEVYSARVTVGSTTAVTSTALTAQRSAGGAVVVRWHTAQETRVVGFVLLRNGTRIGSVIPARGGTRGASYTLTDRTAPRGRQHTYTLRLLRTDGSSSTGAQATIRR
jgi:hypothetical protein